MDMQDNRRLPHLPDLSALGTLHMCAAVRGGGGGGGDVSAQLVRKEERARRKKKKEPAGVSRGKK